jgi:type IV pilus assembly protein PilW
MKKHSMLGFTLIELMISLTLGLVIMLAAMQLLLTNQMSFNLQSGMGNVQENGRFALDYINSTVRSAEYSENIANPTIGIITEISELPGITSAALVTRNDLTSLGKGKSDQLVTRMWVSQTMIDAGFRDCEGNAVATPRFVVTRYFVRADLPAGSTAALACDAGSYQQDAVEMDKVGASFNYGDDGIVLLSTLDSFQILYGVAAVPAPTLGQRYPVRYLNASEYTAILPISSRPNIVSLRAGLLVRSNEKVGTNISTLPDVKVLEKTISGSDLNDKYIHRLFTSTLALRNAI